MRLAPNPVVSFSPLADIHGTLTPNALFYEIHFGGIPAIDPSRAPAAGPRPGRAADAVHDGRPQALPVRLGCPLPGVRRQLLLRVDRSLDGPDGAADRTAGPAAPSGPACRSLLSCARSGSSRVAGGCWPRGPMRRGTNRSIPVAKAMADGLLAYAANGEDLRPSQGYPAAPPAARLRGQHEHQVAAPPEGRHRPWHTRQETSHYTDLMPDGTAREFTFVMEAKSVITSPSGGQTPAGPGLRRDHRPGLVRTRADRPGRRLDRWRDRAGRRRRCRSRCCRSPGRASACPGRGTGKPARLQSRAIDETGYVQPTHGPVGRGPRGELLLPLQRHQDLGHRGERGGEQCLRLTARSASASRPRPSRSPAGTSTSRRTERGCRRAAAPSSRARSSSPG